MYRSVKANMCDSVFANGQARINPATEVKNIMYNIGPTISVKERGPNAKSFSISTLYNIA